MKILKLTLAALFAAGVAVGPLSPAGAADATTATAVSVELNKLEPKDSDCLAYMVFQNGTESSFKEFTLDLYIFGLDGTIAKRLAINAAPLSVGKTKVSLFSIKDLACDTLGNILLNDVIKCSDSSGARDDCVALVDPSSRNDNKFFK